ncbi:MAG: carboxypeptidase regulatory-like domain-containing protein [Isosphaera sp.]|nr:carboxypeptidase regulatory-like domain-containing protein [Isosphaera sp.]
MTPRLVLAAALVAAAGCGTAEEWGGTVSGTVTFDGRPLRSGAVTLVGADGRARNGEVVDGRYAVEAPPLGPCKVLVVTAPEVDEAGRAKAGGKYVELPARYADPARSELTVAVTREPQEHPLVLTR